MSAATESAPGAEPRVNVRAVDAGYGLRIDADGVDPFEMAVDRASMARALGSFDVFDRTAPRFRLTDRLRLEVPLAPAAADAHVPRLWFEAENAQVAWGLCVPGRPELSGLRLPLSEFARFRPALRCRGSVLIDTHSADRAAMALARCLRGSIDVIDFRLGEVKVGFVDAGSHAADGSAPQACRIDFRAVLRIDSVEQATRPIGERLLGAVLEAGFGGPEAPALLACDPARSCELCVTHPVDGERGLI